MDQRLEMYKALDVPEGGMLDPRDIDRDGETGRWTWETARFNDKWKRTLAQQWDSKVIYGLYGREMIQAIEGRSNPFIRNLRFNVNVIYRINKGWLKGSRICGRLPLARGPSPVLWGKGSGWPAGAGPESALLRRKGVYP